MLFHTGYSRLAEAVAKSVVENIEINKNQLIKINSIVDSAIKIIKNGKKKKKIEGRSVLLFSFAKPHQVPVRKTKIKVE